jgi:class 3 adenylate cyclase
MGMLHIPPDLGMKLKEAHLDINKDGEFKNITVMFVGMRGFSHIFEKHNPKKILTILDFYFRMLNSIVHKYDGIIGRLFGDGLMAIWGLPVERKSDTYNAIRAAVEMRIGMYRLIPELVSIGEMPLEIGIGIGTGSAVLGYVGPSSLKELTFVGNCITRASKLQQAASDNRIFVDDATAEKVKSYSYLLYLTKVIYPNLPEEEKSFELDGIYEFNQSFESARKHPRVTVARIVGITKYPSSKRRAALIKSIGEGGIGVELHHYEDFDLDIGDAALFDSSGLSILGGKEVCGLVVRKSDLKDNGIYRIKTWDIGVKFIDISDELKRKLLKVLIGSRMVRNYSIS